jgi:hypothetical protein
LTKLSSRFLVAAAVAVAAAALAGPALAALSPTFAATAPRRGAGTAFGPTLSFATAATDEAVAKVTIYVPSGYTLSSPASPSSTIGNATASIRVGDAVVQGKGTIAGVPAGTTTPSACDDATHVAVWSMNLTAVGQTVSVPMYVDAASGGETAYASYRIVICPPAAARLASATFDVAALTGGNEGDQLWRSLWTSVTGTEVEAQSIARTPTTVTLAAKRSKGKKATRVTLTGVLKEAGNPIGGIAVAIGAGPRPTQVRRVRTVRTNAAGRFSTSVSIAKATRFVPTASVPQRSLGASACKPTFGVPCVSATLGASLVVGDGVKVAR